MSRSSRTCRSANLLVGVARHVDHIAVGRTDKEPPQSPCLFGERVTDLVRVACTRTDPLVHPCPGSGLCPARHCGDTLIQYPGHWAEARVSRPLEGGVSRVRKTGLTASCAALSWLRRAVRLDVHARPVAWVAGPTAL